MTLAHPPRPAGNPGLPPMDVSAAANDAFTPDAIKLDANENAYRAAGRGSASPRVRTAIPSPSRRGCAQ